MIQLYAFVRGLDEAPDELELLDLGGDVAAVVGPALGDDRDDAVRHGLVLQELVESAHAVLPARFGERFPDNGALGTAVAPRRDELGRRLDEVTGCVEVTVRAARSAAPRPVGVGGGDYMRGRLRVVTADAAAAETLHALLRREARDAVVADPALTGVLHDACYLVPRDRIDAFAGAVTEYARAHPELSIVCTGPWAPASFAGAAA